MVTTSPPPHNAVISGNRYTAQQRYDSDRAIGRRRRRRRRNSFVRPWPEIMSSLSRGDALPHCLVQPGFPAPVLSLLNYYKLLQFAMTSVV